jgi:hypothetical protein
LTINIAEVPEILNLKSEIHLTSRFYDQYHASPDTTMSVTFTDRIRVPQDVLISRLQEESVLLNLDNERYYGLDDVGTRMLFVLTSADSVQSAWLQLVDEYDVDSEVLRQDLVSLVERLLEQGLVEISPA